MNKKFLIVLVIIVFIIMGVMYVTGNNREDDNEKVSNTNKNNITPQKTEKQTEREEKVIITHNEIKNIEKIDAFINSISRGNIIEKVDSIIISTYTVEGDEIITKVTYQEAIEQYLISIDNTKDRYANKDEKRIEISGYSFEDYDIVKKTKDGYIYFMLEANKEVDEETQRPLEDVIICSYNQNLEK